MTKHKDDGRAIPLERFAAPARRALTGAGYETVEQVASATEDEMMALHGIGKNAMKTLREILAEHGMSFKDEAG